MSKTTPLLKSLFSIAMVVAFTMFAGSQLYIYAAHAPKAEIYRDLAEPAVVFDEERTATISEWASDLPQTCLWSLNLKSLQINETTVNQAFAENAGFELAVPVLEETLTNIDQTIRCSPLRYQAAALRNRIEAIIGYNPERIKAINEYVSAISQRHSKQVQ